MLRSLQLPLICAVLVTTLPLASCKRSEPPQVKTLPSGREIAIVSMKRGHLDGGGWGLFMVYESQLSFDEKSKVADEITEVWAGIKTNATRNRKIRYVSITAQSRPTGFILSRRDSVEIILHKRPDGNWSGSKP